MLMHLQSQSIRDFCLIIEIGEANNFVFFMVEVMQDERKRVNTNYFMYQYDILPCCLDNIENEQISITKRKWETGFSVQIFNVFTASGSERLQTTIETLRRDDIILSLFLCLEFLFYLEISGFGHICAKFSSSSSLIVNIHGKCLRNGQKY